MAELVKIEGTGTGTDADERPALIEFNPGSFPKMSATNVYDAAWQATFTAIQTLYRCPYCEGGQEYRATLTRPDGSQLEFRAVCGQCAGTGRRVEGDARKLVSDLLESFRTAYLEPDEEGWYPAPADDALEAWEPAGVPEPERDPVTGEVLNDVPF